MSGFGGNGGFSFKTTTGNSTRRQGTGGLMYDDHGYDRAGSSDRSGGDNGGTRRNAPLRGIGGASGKRGDRRDEVREEEFDDYRPGSRLMTEGRMWDSYDSFRPENWDNGGFDEDDFGDAAYMDDDFGGGFRPAPRNNPRNDQRNAQRNGGIRGQQRSQGRDRREQRRGRNDYTEEDFYDEFSGVRGIGGSYNDELPDPVVRRGSIKGRRTPPGTPDYSTGQQARSYDDYEVYDDPDGYYGRATIRDTGYDGSGVPKIFSRYFSDDDGYEQRDHSVYNRPSARRSGNPNGIRSGNPNGIRSGNPNGVRSNDLYSRGGAQRNQVRNITNLSSSGRRMFRLMSVILTAVIGGSALIYGIGYLALGRTASPLNVSTALTAMQDNVSNTLLRSSVDRTLSSRTVQVSVGGNISSMSLADCEFRYSSDGDGDEHKEWSKVVSGSDMVNVQYTYMTKGSIRFNETKVKDFLHKASGGSAVRMIEPDYIVDIRQNIDTKVYDGTLTITEGSNGYGIDFDTFINELMKHIATDDSSPIIAELTETVAPPVDIDKIYEKVHTEAVDAYKRTDGSGEVVYEKEVIGVDFDRRAAAERITEGGGKWVISLALTIPKVTRKALMAETFPDLLATYSTPFNANNQARSSNLALAGDYINGTILQPGEVFSYNKTVGERTRERGFCKATVYSSEGTDEDYGGGICQTSSTLFYAAMKANLELVKRTNHLYTVMYMVDEKGNTQCFGNDATVNWPNVDMQFRNNKEYPIKIECITKNGVITFNIWGTWDGYTAEYRYVEQATERYQIVYRKYKEGKKNQAGQLGRTIWTYRVVFYQEEQGVGERKEVDRYREFISQYRPLSQIKYVNSPPAGYEFDKAYNT